MDDKIDIITCGTKELVENQFYFFVTWDKLWNELEIIGIY